MSDVSKTNELIVAKLRKAAKQAEWYQALDPKLLTAAADALATRVPVQGEPRDVRELLHAKCDCVPDLGPEHCHLCGNVKGSPVPWSECDSVTHFVPDAALAAIERVRAVAEDGVWRDTKTSGDWAWALDHMAHKILAALDGAPEPEWEYRYAEIHDDSEMYTYGPRDNADGCFDTAEDARDERIEDTDVVVRRPKRPASEWEVCE